MHNFGLSDQEIKMNLFERTIVSTIELFPLKLQN